MLILVAVTINMAVNGGLFGYAGNAARETKKEKEKEENWTNIEDNMTTDELIDFYTSGPKEWIIAWVYKNNAWSNPYFKDETLENTFSFEDIDTNYSINSENELTGQFVVKLYPDGELNFSGTGAIPEVMINGYELNPIKGCCHVDVNSSYANQNNGAYAIIDGDFYNYLKNNIKSVVFGEGITSISEMSFSDLNQLSNVKFSSTITSI